MGVSEKVLEALRAAIVLNDRVATFSEKVVRMDQDLRRVNERLVRVETIIEMARTPAVSKRLKP